MSLKTQSNQRKSPKSIAEEYEDKGWEGEKFFRILLNSLYAFRTKALTRAT